MQYRFVLPQQISRAGCSAVLGLHPLLTPFLFFLPVSWGGEASVSPLTSSSLIWSTWFNHCCSIKLSSYHDIIPYLWVPRLSITYFAYYTNISPSPQLICLVLGNRYPNITMPSWLILKSSQGRINTLVILVSYLFFHCHLMFLDKFLHFCCKVVTLSFRIFL